MLTVITREQDFSSGERQVRRATLNAHRRNQSRLSLSGPLHQVMARRSPLHIHACSATNAAGIFRVLDVYFTF